MLREGFQDLKEEWGLVRCGRGGARGPGSCRLLVVARMQRAGGSQQDGGQGWASGTLSIFPFTYSPGLPIGLRLPRGWAGRTFPLVMQALRELPREGSLMGALGTPFPVRTPSTSETETSATCQEYRSTSATTVASSDSLLLKSQSSDLENYMEDLSLSHSPRKIKAALGQSWRTHKTEAARDPSQGPSKTKATQGPRPKPNKTKVTQRPRQRLRKAKVAHGQSWGLMRSSSKTKTIYDPSWSPSNIEASQSQYQWPSKTEVTQGRNENRSPGSYTAL